MLKGVNGSAVVIDRNERVVFVHDRDCLHAFRWLSGASNRDGVAGLHAVIVPRDHDAVHRNASALEQLLNADTTRRDFCFGSSPTLADVYLVPQVESARRFKVDLARWPTISAVDTACAQLEAFRLAAPALQPDAY